MINIILLVQYVAPYNIWYNQSLGIILIKYIYASYLIKEHIGGVKMWFEGMKYINLDEIYANPKERQEIINKAQDEMSENKISQEKIE